MPLDTQKAAAIMASKQHPLEKLADVGSERSGNVWELPVLCRAIFSSTNGCWCDFAAANLKPMKEVLLERCSIFSPAQGQGHKEKPWKRQQVVVTNKLDP